MLFFVCMISYVQGRVPKTVLRAQNLVNEKLYFMKVC